MVDIALAASVREWPDRLHRFLLDHGGGRIVGRVMGPDQATATRCDILLIDDVCSFLTPRLITSLKTGGVEVIGVYAPEDGSDAKRHLLECGISDVIETEASPEEFLEKVTQTLAHRIVPVPDDVPSSSPLSICVTGPSAGVGVTEVAISLARAISETTATGLVDLDPVWPSVAQRLGLPVHPNIRTALDHAFHTPDRIRSATLEVEDGLTVIGGLADGGAGARISRHDVLTLLDAIGAFCDVVVADIGPITQAEKGLLREFDSLLVVGRGDPVGIARLIKTVARLLEERPEPSILTVVNCLERGSFRRSEIVAEFDRALPDVPVVTLPFDTRLGRAAWDGALDAGPRLRKAVASMSEVVVRSLR
jgi:Flp pilus assembly CpaE family ATPase